MAEADRRIQRPPGNPIRSGVAHSRNVSRLGVAVRCPVAARIGHTLGKLGRTAHCAARAVRRSLDPSYAPTVTFLSVVS
jgi:hypothetical protein